MEPFAKGTLPISLEEEMRRSYLDYAMSVIVGRALPDVRDGLKPVHRRVLYAMHEANNTWNRPYVKCARIVGDVLGKYHPHGDTATYEALVRMAQDFSMRYTLVDGQGNFGSVDGDAAAAYRYTECRLDRIASEILPDIDKETVDLTPNYDGKEREPAVLPTRVPNLLVNGSSGIAVGMATNIPPHNLGEVVDACLHVLAQPHCAIEEVIKLMPAPDFPTAGIIYGLGGVHEGYRTGRGRVVIRARTHFEEVGRGDRQAVIVDELPYQVNEKALLERIAELVTEKKLEGVSDIRDESDRSGMRVVIELKRGEIPEVVLNNLFKQTQLQDTFGINMVALVDGQPRLQRLTGLERDKIRDEYREVIENIVELLDILAQPSLIMAIIAEELKKIKEEFGDARRSEIVTVAEDIAIEDLIAPQDMVVTFSHGGYVKSQPLADYRAQRRGGRGKMATTMKEDDFIERLFVAHSHDHLLCFSNRGRLYWLKVYEVPAGSRSSRGKPIVNMFPLEEGEKITAVVPVKEFDENHYVFMATSQGTVKKTPLAEFSRPRPSGIIAVGLDEGDYLVGAALTDGKYNVMLFSSDGKAVRFQEGDVRPMGRQATGVRGMRLGKGQRVVCMLAAHDESKSVLTATEHGFGKRTPIGEYPRHGRGGQGVIAMSHRGKEFVGIAADAERDLRELLAVPQNYKLLFLQGGATLQFAQVPMNLLRGKGKADYVSTGEWSKKAIREAKAFCDVHVAASSEDRNFTYAPKKWNVRKDAAYVHYCSNETIGGVEYHEVVNVNGIPLVADASSHFLSRPLEVSKFGLIYAGAQKNVGPAGLTIVIVREDLLGNAAKGTPSVMDYKLQAGADSMLNTPPTYSMYIAGLVFKWVKQQGGVREVEKRNIQKAALLYDLLDSRSFYKNPLD